MECVQKGLLTREETDGLDMTWGNHEAVHAMMQRIARRQGFGAVLAEGAMLAARHIGGEAPDFAVHTMKGNIPRHHDHRNAWPMLFDTCVSQMSSDEGFTMAHTEEVGFSIQRHYNVYNTSADDTLILNTRCKGAGQFEDSLGVCRFVTRTDMGLLCKAVSAATGWDFTIEEGMEAGRRTITLLRVFNLRHGHTAEMDFPSARYGSAPVDGPTQGRSIMPHWDTLRRTYYESMGWDRLTGKPLAETLKRYGFKEAAVEVWGRACDEKDPHAAGAE
jgi:aldehyde:ferredoxin oxidoreductase